MSATPEVLPGSPPAPVPGCRLCVAVIGDAESALCALAVDDVVGPSFVGQPVVASDGLTLVAIGHDADGVIRVWRGQPSSLIEVAIIDAEVELVALVRHLGQWHLFGAGAGGDGRAWHAMSADLVSWTQDERFAAEHPLLVVRGAISMPDGVVILGEVILSGRRVGWTLLDGEVGAYRAREVTFPLTAAHGVVGPVYVNDDEMGLLLSSDAAHLLARTVPGTKGRSWAVSLLSPDMEPSVALSHGGHMWVAGGDPVCGAPLVATVGGPLFHLDRTMGSVCAGTIHRDQLVLARWTTADDSAQSSPPQQPIIPIATGTTKSVAVMAQSSPAYMDSISAA